MLALKSTALRVGAASVLMVAVIAGGLVPAESASAGATGTAMVTTQRMSDATLNSTQNGWYGKGAVLSLSCYKIGQAVKGYYSAYVGNGGWDSLWYKTSDGYFVADIDLNTGSNQPVTSPCSTAPTAPATGIAAKVNAFVAQYNNRFVDYDGRYGAQCVDLFNYYNRDVVKASFVSVNYAYQLWGAAPTNKYSRVSASSTPQKGDVAVFSSSLPGSGGAGHVAIVLSQVNSTTLSVFQQRVRLSNGSYSPSIVSNSSKSYLLGYLRPIL